MNTLNMYIQLWISVIQLWISICVILDCDDVYPVIESRGMEFTTKLLWISKV